MGLVFQIAVGSSVPIYRQISEQVRLGVAAGKLTPGEQLPSVRALAEDLVINVNTVAKAYADLSREGLIETQPGRGVFVAERRQRYTKQERVRRLEPTLRTLLSEATALGYTGGELLEILRKEVSKWEPTPSSQLKIESSDE